MKRIRVQKGLPMVPMNQLTIQNLLEHHGHNLRTAVWTDLRDPVNVALVCEDCHEVLADWDRVVELNE